MSINVPLGCWEIIETRTYGGDSEQEIEEGISVWMPGHVFDVIRHRDHVNKGEAFMRAVEPAALVFPTLPWLLLCSPSLVPLQSLLLCQTMGALRTERSR